MPFPAGLTLVTVAIRFDTPPSGGAVGKVVFRIPRPLTGATDGSIVPPVTLTANLDTDGTASIQLPATNDPQWTPTGWTYTVTAHVAGTSTTGTLQLDYQTPSIELADLIQWDGAATTGTTYATLAQLGEKVAKAGDTMTGALTVQDDLSVDGGVLRINGDPGTFRQIQYGSGASEAATRWSIHVNNTAESGGNAGSNLRIVRYSDAGEALDAPLGIDRATGAVALETGLTVAAVDFRQATAHARPVDHGLVGWTFDPAQIQAGTVQPTAGLAQVTRVRVLSSVVTNVHFHLTAGGSSLTSGRCFAALYNDAGALLGAGAVTADQSTNWATSGYKTCALSVAQGVTPYAYYRVLWWFQGTTGPTIARAADVSAAALNAGMSAPTLRYSTADAGLTTAAPSNIGAQTGSATAWWVGLS